ncbi:MAG: hypothetical protein U0746_15450 [Gemmataceae bacterium]
MSRNGIGVTAAFSVWMGIVSPACAADIQPGLYLRTTYAFGNLALNTIYIGTGNRIAIDPKNGIDPFDFDAAAKESPSKVGTFRIEGNKIVVTWTGGKKVEKLDVEFEKGVFSAYDGGLVTKAESYPKNKTLAATFAGSGQTANVSAARTLTLSADGKYTMTLLGGIRGIPGKPGVAETTVQGTYKLNGNTLALTASNGQVTKHTVMPFNTALDPKKAKLSDEHMIFDGANLKREK